MNLREQDASLETLQNAEAERAACRRLEVEIAEVSRSRARWIACATARGTELGDALKERDSLRARVRELEENVRLAELAHGADFEESERDNATLLERVAVLESRLEHAKAVFAEMVAKGDPTASLARRALARLTSSNGTHPVPAGAGS